MNLQGRLDPHILISYEELSFENATFPGFRCVFGVFRPKSEVAAFPGRFEINCFFRWPKKVQSGPVPCQFYVISGAISLFLAIYRGYTHA